MGLCTDCMGAVMRCKDFSIVKNTGNKMNGLLKRLIY